MEDRAWKLYVAAGIMAWAAYFRVPGLHGNGLLFDGVSLSAAVAIVAGVRRHRPEHPLAWYCLAAAQLAFVAGDLVYYSFNLSYPNIGDFFYLVFYPLEVAGLVLLVRRRTPGRDRASLIDAAIIALGLGVLSWVFLIGPTAAADGALAERLVSTAYPLMDVLLLSVAARLAFGPGARPRAFWFLMAGITILLATDAVYSWIEVTSGYNQGGLLDSGWMAFYLLTGAAALHPSMRVLSERGAPPEVRVSRRRLGLLAAATLMAPAVEFVQDLRHGADHLPIVSAASAVLFLLVLARMSGVLADLRRAMARERALAAETVALNEEVERRRSEARLGALVQNSSDVIAVLQPDLTIRYQTPSAARLFGVAPDGLVGTALVDLLHPDDVPRAITFYAEHLTRPGGSPPGEWRLRHRDGSWVDTEIVSNNLLADPNVEGVVLTIRDVRERKALEEQLRHQAFHDGLTALANRALFLNRLEHALGRAESDGARAGVLLVDLDDFGAVNDRLGHAAGDALLVEVARRLKACVRPADTPARLGSDEFAVLMAEIGEDDEAVAVAERILSAFDEPFVVPEGEVRLSASIGVACATVGGSEAEAEVLLRNAEVASYTAKGRGKGRCEPFEPVMHRQTLERLELRAELREALGKGEFVLHYQPVARLGTGEIVGVEALVRWAHPVRGIVPPGDFIPVCEESGLIVPIGKFVLEEACRQAARWRGEGPGGSGLSVSINLSAMQLAHPKIVDHVAGALRASGADPARIVLEITESAAVDADALATLRALKDLGVRLAIDDFGTGYSSLSYLDRLPVDVLKIDRAFTARITGARQESALARAIVALGPTLGMRTVAEGVETAEQWRLLAELGCDFAQGFLLSRPVDPAAVDELLRHPPHNPAAAADGTPCAA